GGQHVQGATLTARDYRFECSPTPLGAGHGGAKDEGKQTAQAEDEGQDVLVSTREGDQGERVDFRPTAVVAKSRPVGDCADAQSRAHEQSAKPRQGDPGRRPPAYLFERGTEDPHAGGAGPWRDVAMGGNVRSDEAAPWVGVRNSSSGPGPPRSSVA